MNRTQEIEAPGEAVGEDRLQVVGKKFPPPLFTVLLQAINELEWKVRTPGKEALESIVPISRRLAAGDCWKPTPRRLLTFHLEPISLQIRAAKVPEETFAAHRYESQH
jgi:hypothetical protein